MYVYFSRLKKAAMTWFFAHTGLNSLNPLNSNVKEQKPVFLKKFLINTLTER